VSVADEVKLGRDAQQQLPRVRGGIASYVSSIGRRLAGEARGPRYPYSFTIADYREINAFALPGGPIWINRGALELPRASRSWRGFSRTTWRTSRGATRPTRSRKASSPTVCSVSSENREPVRQDREVRRPSLQP
jgi:hypothetical protein